MNTMIQHIADWLLKCGQKNAGIPSILGSFETQVPQQLQEQDKQ